MMDESQLVEYVRLALEVVGLFAGIAAVTPTPKDDNILAKVKVIINALALNVWNARNEQQPGRKF
jgi:hypothetical protein